MSAGSGLVLIDKPEGWTSHDIVAKTRKFAGTRAVGHAGTLDPMATGLLILGVNGATKLLTFLVGETKTYEATIRLGASTVTDDRESEFLSIADRATVEAISSEAIEAAMDTLRGPISQVPSSVSAIKVDGQRAYAMVRSGDEVVLKARPVEITRFELQSPAQFNLQDGHAFWDLPVVIDCSSGTYVRALARDLGELLGVGGHLIALRRTRIGKYQVSDAQPMQSVSAENLKVVLAVQVATELFSPRQLTQQDMIDLRHGKQISLGDISGDADLPIAGIGPDGALGAILTRAGKRLKSLVVFQPETR